MLQDLSVGSLFKKVHILHDHSPEGALVVAVHASLSSAEVVSSVGLASSGLGLLSPRLCSAVPSRLATQSLSLPSKPVSVPPAEACNAAFNWSSLDGSLTSMFLSDTTPNS